MRYSASVWITGRSPSTPICSGAKTATPTCAILALKNGMEAKELAQMLGHYRPTITRQNYEPYLPHKAQKDEAVPNEATQDELQQAANILDNLLKF